MSKTKKRWLQASGLVVVALVLAVAVANRAVIAEQVRELQAARD